jgi:hypothetical protein
MKCSIVDCDKQATGGFQHLVDAGSSENAEAKIEGLKTLWCDEHRSSLRPDCIGEKGHWLREEDVRGLGA